MRCTGYCTSGSFEIQRLYLHLQSSGGTQIYRDVVHTQVKEDKAAKKDIFYFAYGTIVFWGFEEDEEKQILESLREFELERLSKIEIDEFSFLYGDKLKIEEDQIILSKKDPLLKLALSYAIGQSVKLAGFEEVISRTVENSKQIPKDLAHRGKITLSRKETSQKMGELFLERNYVNLHTEILDTPEFFWEHSELEPMYRRMIHYLEVTKRVDLLNRRLTLMHELYEILSNELNHQQSSRLEMTIIVLILIEIVLALSRDFFHWL